jgi:hypothetical protein
MAFLLTTMFIFCYYFFAKVINFQIDFQKLVFYNHKIDL